MITSPLLPNSPYPVPSPVRAVTTPVSPVAAAGWNRPSSMTNTMSFSSMFGSMLPLSMATIGGQTPLIANRYAPTSITASTVTATSRTTSVQSSPSSSVRWP